MEHDSDAPASDLAPRPRPGWRSRRPDPVDVNAAPQLFVAAMGGGLGIVALVAALLYLPPNMSTPVLAGVSILMITRGAYGAWRVGAAEPRFQRAARVFTWGLPLGAITVLVLVMVLGVGGLAPDYAALLGEPPPAGPPPLPTVTFEPR